MRSARTASRVSLSAGRTNSRRMHRALFGEDFPENRRELPLLFRVGEEIEPTVAEHDVARRGREFHLEPVLAPGGLSRPRPHRLNYLHRTVDGQKVRPLRPRQPIEFRRHPQEQHPRRRTLSAPRADRLLAETHIFRRRPKRRPEEFPVPRDLRPLTGPVRAPCWAALFTRLRSTKAAPPDSVTLSARTWISETRFSQPLANACSRAAALRDYTRCASLAVRASRSATASDMRFFRERLRRHTDPDSRTCVRGTPDARTSLSADRSSEGHGVPEPALSAIRALRSAACRPPSRTPRRLLVQGRLGTPHGAPRCPAHAHASRGRVGSLPGSRTRCAAGMDRRRLVKRSLPKNAKLASGASSTTIRRRGFDFSRFPLMRLALFRLADDDFYFVWTYHHALLDGPSRSRVLEELFGLYDALRRGEDYRLADARHPFALSWNG